MNADLYQDLAGRFWSGNEANLDYLTEEEYLRRCKAVGPRLLAGVMGLAGEAGEAIELVKKILFQRHPQDSSFHEKLTKELGDVAWYLALAAGGLRTKLSEVMGLEEPALVKCPICGATAVCKDQGVHCGRCQAVIQPEDPLRAARGILDDMVKLARGCLLQLDSSPESRLWFEQASLSQLIIRLYEIGKSRGGERNSAFIDIVFDGPPSHESGRFVECEGPDGASVKAGEWIARGNGLWALRIPTVSPTPKGATLLVWTPGAPPANMPGYGQEIIVDQEGYGLEIFVLRPIQFSISLDACPWLNSAGRNPREPVRWAPLPGE